MGLTVLVRMKVIGFYLTGIQVEMAVELVLLAQPSEGLGVLLPDVSCLDELVDALQEVVAVGGQMEEGGSVDQEGQQIGNPDLPVGGQLGFGIFQAEGMGNVGPVQQMEQQRAHLLDGGGGGGEGDFRSVGQLQGKAALPVAQRPANQLFDQRGDDPTAGLPDG